MNLETSILTAVVTLVILAIVSIMMVIRYKKDHQAEIRQALVNKAFRHGIASPEDLSNHDLSLQIREAKRQRKNNENEFKTV
ncbi:hypothetical protein [Glutamicibacter sp. JC586]|uniref:hypothetical protein n=1 Tax=Glutamicibacter sp. JC586 TaxID=2590552 RepID=UPI00135C5892|nr:hypothetical protein [Glutamicibacter sp. JC586]